MYPLNYSVIITVLCTILIETAIGKGGSNSKKDNWNKQNNKFNSAYEKNTIFIDEKPQDGMGSGYNGYRMDMNSDDEDDFSSGDNFNDDEDMGSGYFSNHAQNCNLLRKQIMDKGMRGVYLPECTNNGNFKPKQCHQDTNVCWCVDSQGYEIDNTRELNSNLVYCDGPLVEAPIKRKKANSGNNNNNGEIIDVPSDPSKDDGFIDEGLIIEPTDDISNHIDIVNKDGNNVDIKQAYDPEKNSFEMIKGEENLDTSSRAMMQPGMLAVVIGGTVVGLLCAVLLVMFIVYRMRKKDEGSYALEEPKRSPSLHMYSRAPTKEFYA